MAQETYRLGYWRPSIQMLFPGIGGTLEKHARRGDNVILLSVTYGIHVHTEQLRDKSVEEMKDIVREKSTEPRL